MTDIAPKTRRFSARTHVGLHRKVNEDAILALPQLGLWAISDGMGGHAGGDFASQTVVDTLSRLSPDLDPPEIMHAARAALHAAHDTIRAEAARRGDHVIGATAVLLALSDAHFMCLWAGDSRLYRLRAGRVEMISVDHSIVGELVEAGQMTWADAEHHPHSNQITRAVGFGDVLDIDKRRGDTQPGDRFLLCSDGLTKYADAPLLERLMADTPIEDLADRLVQVALDGGGADNVSIIAVDI